MSQSSVGKLESPFKSTGGESPTEDVVILGSNGAAHELSFIVKRQKRCNFCGELQPLPRKFTFQRKCRKCSLKNSTFVFPARFLCNSCREGSEDDIQRVESDQIPLDNLKNAEVLHSDSMIRKLQGLIARAFHLALAD